jgi:branched-subunit amino acid ABC-type transport system permease component
VSLSSLFSQFMGGLTAAMFLFLIASGLSLIFGVLRVLNFAHGSFYMIGAYIAWQVVHWVTTTTGHFWLAAPARRSAWPSSAGSSSGCCSAISMAARSSTSCSSPTRWC